MNMCTRYVWRERDREIGGRRYSKRHTSRMKQPGGREGGRVICIYVASAVVSEQNDKIK